MKDFLIRGDFEELDPDLHELTEIEAERQARRLILIPSESAAPMAVRQVLGSAFHNVYAEGYPPEGTRRLAEGQILDYAQRLAHYRRYSDPRYYKGVEYVDVVEALARRRCAETFAANGIGPDDLYVNVQPLSGGPANNAVYHALVEPGQTVLGMDLRHGGHLSHGSPVNRSGKYYHAVHYTVDPQTERIDYDQVAAVAAEHQPKMIIAGYSSYPWSVDWARFREIADSVGAYLLADIAHVAGLVAAGIYPSPVGLADVISFTTHKSLCGPRGAAIITHDRKLAKAIDRAVFPGEQGGPHINTIAAQALAFKLAQTESFRQLQQQVVDNCLALTEGIADGGLRIAYGGTDTHLTNVDCKSIVGEGGATLSGDMAARILDRIGIVCNRNTLPGDESARDPSGIRLGTPWITQRGYSAEDCRRLGGLIARSLRACRPFRYPQREGGPLRAKIDFEPLHELTAEVDELAAKGGLDYTPSDHGYPHFYALADPLPAGKYVLLELTGDDPDAVVRWATSARPGAVDAGQPIGASLAGPGGMADVVLSRLGSGGWQLAVESSAAAWVRAWLRDLSDGYVTVDAEDLHRKIPGPFVVRETGGAAAPPEPVDRADGEDKPWYVGAGPSSGQAPLPAFERPVEPADELKRTALYEAHSELGAKMVPFAGWEMPVWYDSVLEEHLAVRRAAGLFDVSHMGVYSVDGAGAAAFLDSVVGNDVAGLAVGRSLYTHFLTPGGDVIDDLMIYRRPDGYLLVVNAANDAVDWAWLNAVKDGAVRIDDERPGSKAFGRGCRLRDLRDPATGPDRRVDLAIQGPASRQVLQALDPDQATSERLAGLGWAGVMEGSFGGFELVVARTGYTGERVAYELFVQPDRSVDLWQALLQAGEPFGLKPVGLGARDSLRTEAGLPLYGHEMAGEMNLGVGDAGFIGYVKTYKPWFIGRQALLRQERERTSEVARFRFEDKGVRMAHYGDPVVDHRGKVIGRVTSCAVDSDGYLLGQAHLDLGSCQAGTLIGVFQGGYRGQESAPTLGDRLAIPTPARVLPRFPD